jgi:hypothetical protein
MNHRPKGFCTLVSATDCDGKTMKLSDVVRLGLVTPVRAPAGFDLPADEVPIGANLFLDNARQYMAYAMAFRSPISNYTIQRFGVGTGTLPPNTGDVQLQNRVELTPSSGIYTKLIDTVDFPAPFVARFQFTIGVAEFVGYSITELGLYSGDETIMSRWTLPSGVNLDGTWSPTWAHRLVF